MVFSNQKQQTTTDASIGKPLLGMSKNEKNQELRYHFEKYILRWFYERNKWTFEKIENYWIFEK